MDRLDSSQNTPQDAPAATEPTMSGTTGSVTAEPIGSMSTGSYGTAETIDVTDSAMSTKEQAKGVAEDAAGRAKDVAGEATEQVKSVAQAATEQTKTLFSGVGQDLSQEVESQKDRIAALLRQLGDELDEAAGRGEAGGRVASFAGDAAYRAREASQWLETHHSGEFVDMIGDFARRRPMTFVAASAAAGLVMGRLTRGMVASARSDDEAGTGIGQVQPVVGPITPLGTGIDTPYGTPLGGTVGTVTPAYPAYSTGAPDDGALGTQAEGEVYDRGTLGSYGGNS